LEDAFYFIVIQNGMEDTLHCDLLWRLLELLQDRRLTHGHKLDLYQVAKIPEYLAILRFEQEIRWHVLVNGVYELMPPDADRVWRSRIFPGLWLDGRALLAGDAARVLAQLDEGLRSPEHKAFVEKLARNAAKGH
jgi:Putative restriction endonuclease